MNNTELGFLDDEELQKLMVGGQHAYYFAKKLIELRRTLEGTTLSHQDLLDLDFYRKELPRIANQDKELAAALDYVGKVQDSIERRPAVKATLKSFGWLLK